MTTISGGVDDDAQVTSIDVLVHWILGQSKVSEMEPPGYSEIESADLFVGKILEIFFLLSVACPLFLQACIPIGLIK